MATNTVTQDWDAIKKPGNYRSIVSLPNECPGGSGGRICTVYSGKQVMRDTNSANVFERTFSGNVFSAWSQIFDGIEYLTGTEFIGQLKLQKGSNIAAATTLIIPSDGNFFTVTGSGQSISTISLYDQSIFPGRRIKIMFSSANTNEIVSGGNIVFPVGVPGFLNSYENMVIEFQQLQNGDWEIIDGTFDNCNNRLIWSNDDFVENKYFASDDDIHEYADIQRLEFKNVTFDGIEMVWKCPTNPTMIVNGDVTIKNGAIVRSATIMTRYSGYLSCGRGINGNNGGYGGFGNNTQSTNGGVGLNGGGNGGDGNANNRGGGGGGFAGGDGGSGVYGGGGGVGGGNGGAPAMFFFVKGNLFIDQTSTLSSIGSDIGGGGGGAICIICMGNIVNHGTISADGGYGDTNGSGGGGLVFIRYGGTYTNTGSVTANAGGVSTGTQGTAGDIDIAQLTNDGTALTGYHNIFSLLGAM